MADDATPEAGQEPLANGADTTPAAGLISQYVKDLSVENPNAPLPYDYNTGQIPEKQVKMLGETDEMEPNAEKTISLDLKPGNYLLICNVPGHYAAGMWTPLTVTQ